MPFMSRYKLSNSKPFGFGRDVSTGTLRPVSSHVARSSLQSTTIFGYFVESHLKKAGTPMTTGGSAAGWQDGG